MKRFDGKTVIITGSAGGIGAGTVEVFAEEGANVVIADIKDGKGFSDSLNAKGYKTIFVKTDVTKESDLKNLVDTTVKTFGTVDVLFNNAGIISMHPLQDESLETWNRVMNINLTSYLLLAQLVAPIMKGRGKGVMINTCSVAGFNAHHGLAAYVTSKHAVAGLTKSMAWELGPEIRVNAIAPGAIHTPMVDSVGGLDAVQHLIDGSPLKRVGHPRDIGTVAAFLASDESSFITGQILRVDGGIEI